MRSARFPLAAVLIFGCAFALCGPSRSAGQGDWAARFKVDPRELSPNGRNPYFILEPGYQRILESGANRLVVTVLEHTHPVDGVETRIVEERETKNERLVEISRNFFAISKRTNDVYYFGEDVDQFKDDDVIGHEGGWLAGVKGAKFGLMMPGEPRLGAKYYQELAPKIAMDRAEIVSLHERVVTPWREFSDCLKVEETTPLEPGVKAYKFYAPGIGLVQDGELKLVKFRRR